jgi:hypothetical protein
MPKAKVAFLWYGCADGRLESFVSSFWKEDHVDEIIQKYSYTDYTGADAPKVQEDKERCDRLSALMFKLLVVLNTRPNLVEPTTCIRRACSHKGRLRSELWSPNIIGAAYRVARENVTPIWDRVSGWPGPVLVEPALANERCDDVRSPESNNCAVPKHLVAGRSQSP